MIAEKRDWRTYRSKHELAWVDDFEKKLRTNLDDPKGQFFLLTLAPHRSESAHLSDYDRQYATPRSSIVHKSLTSRSIRLYRQWNKLFFKRPSADIGCHFPMLLCVDDPIVMSGGVTHEESNGPHAHIIIGIQAKHVERWQRMARAGHLQADVEKLFPRGDLDVRPLPEADVGKVVSYSLKYEFATVSNEPLWYFFK